jgi:hypothetical protein
LTENIGLSVDEPFSHSAPMPTTSTSDTKRSIRERLPDLKPTTFRVVLGLGVFAFVVLLHLQLGNEGYVPAISAGSLAWSFVLGLLAYWLAQSFVMFLIVFCPVVAITALLIAIYGWVTQ